MRDSFKMRTVLLSLCTFLIGCSDTRYVDYGDKNSADQTIARTVEFEIRPAFYETPPDCVIVLKPRVEQGLQQFTLPVEHAFSRYLSERIPRVIDGQMRDAVAKQLAFDLSQKSDLEQFSNKTKCSTVLASRIVGPGHTFLLVWSRIQIGIEGQLIRLSDGAILWRARHLVGRSDGGISISPIGMAVDAVSSASLVNDKDVSVSIADDGVRRLMQSLPMLHSAPKNTESFYPQY